MANSTFLLSIESIRLDFAKWLSDIPPYLNIYLDISTLEYITRISYELAKIQNNFEENKVEYTLNKADFELDCKIIIACFNSISKNFKKRLDVNGISFSQYVALIISHAKLAKVARKFKRCAKKQIKRYKL